MHRPTGEGGWWDGLIRHKLLAGLEQRGVSVAHDLKGFPYRSVLVIGGTRDLPGLWSARRRGTPVVQRLDGMNWLHRLEGLPGVGLRRYLRAEYGNFLLALIRRRFATRIIYQSEFARAWWNRQHGESSLENSVIYNGVDLDRYHPNAEDETPKDRWRILMVEGSLMGGYEQGLNVAFRLIETLAERYSDQLFKNERSFVELMVVGRVPAVTRELWDARIARSKQASKIRIEWAGQVPPEHIPSIDRSAHLLYSSDIHPACPNSVIEALACGLPVLSFDTGSLQELVSEGAGKVVPYGGDSWKLDPPDIEGLASAGMEILLDLECYRRSARQRAEQHFGLDRMVDAYVDCL